MPVFSFTLPKLKTTIKQSTINKENIIETDIEGVIHITLEGKFYIITSENKEYKIYKDCYSCKGKQRVYFIMLDSKTKSRICWDRIENRQELSDKHYLPFAPGCCVKGSIIKHLGVEYFKINKVFINNSIPNSKEALKFYKDNYKEIQKNRFKEEFVE